MKKSRILILPLLVLPTIAFVQRSGPPPLPIAGIICKDECPNWTHCSTYGTLFMNKGVCRAIDDFPDVPDCTNTYWDLYYCTAGSASIGAKFSTDTVEGSCGGNNECYGS